ncbi:MAG: 16S rRNA (cytosine(967)-C(5))-methyltransferase RsmB [Myxococcota bacterium]
MSAREIAWSVLNRVDRDRAFADLALNAELRASRLEARERALATELTYGTLRLRGRLDALLAQCIDEARRRPDLRVRNLLRLGAYQILRMSRIPDSAAVSETVDLAKRGGLERAAGFVNAILRKLARAAAADELRLPEFAADPIAHLRDACSLPEWLARRWLDQLGPEPARALAEACLKPPARTVRVSAGVDREAVARRLGGRLCRYAPRGVTALRRVPVRDPGFARGEFTVQDEASQLVPLLLGVETGDTVVDCCAAPGSKTVQLAELVGPKGEVVALELHRSRLPLIYRAALRLGLENLRILQRDVAQGFDLQGRLYFKRVLVDAPCSGLGTLQRNPDARWRLEPGQIDRWASRGLEILSSAARYVEDGGVLVYSVCTHTSEETDRVIKRFLEERREFRLDDPRPWLPEPAAELVDEGLALRTFPHRHGCDGFFAVRLVRG